LGTLSWNKNDSSLIGVPCFYATVPNIKLGRISMVCSVYEAKPQRTNINGTSQIAKGNLIDATYVVVRDDRYASSDAQTFTTAMDGEKLCYELATPLTVSLSPSQLSTLLGQNNIWADTGAVSVEYRADTKLYTDAQIEAKTTAVKRIMTTTTNTMVAPKNLISGEIIIVNDDAYKATSNIASGAALTVGTNVQKVTLAEWVASLIA